MGIVVWSVQKQLAEALSPQVLVVLKPRKECDPAGSSGKAPGKAWGECRQHGGDPIGRSRSDVKTKTNKGGCHAIPHKCSERKGPSRSELMD
eukprot:1177088-Prorocentrum_minimum.AAC.6